MAMQRRYPVVATYTLAGHHDEVLRLEPRTSGGGGAGVAGNLILGGVVGLATDTVTGAGFDLQPNPARVVMRPIPAPAPASPVARRR
jgi:hypothetical protein